MKNPKVRQSFGASGNQAMPATSLAELDRVHQAERVRYQTIARPINLQPQH